MRCDFNAKLFLLLILKSSPKPGAAFSMHMSRSSGSSSSGSSSSSSGVVTMIYGVPNSGWTSPRWNWGSAAGTGHDCAHICRQKYKTLQSRQDLIDDLLEGESNRVVDFEEVKLILALTWQRGRWDGSDGGRGGYGDVLKLMAEANRYEQGSEAECSRRLVQDMQARFQSLKPSSEDHDAMVGLSVAGDEIFDARYQCAGLVLQCMGFVENGC